MGATPILELIKKRIVVLDGAMGSALITAGLKGGIPPESWNIEKSEIIKKIHSDYYAAGSDVVLTNTFGGTRIKLEALKHGDKFEEYNIAAVENAREVCPENGYVAGDIGPTGKFLPPVGKVTVDDFYENFLEQAKILAENKVDLFFIETMSDIKEAVSAVKAVKKVSNVPVIASITFQKTKRGYFTIMGNSVEESTMELASVGVDVIGANCTIGSDDMIDLIPLLRNATKLPICAKPNAGKPELVSGETVYSTTPKQFTRDILQMIEKEVNVVGGCCGTNPDFIKNLTAVIKGREI
ncbi:MAG: homocysteine S-methyltransferase family protein [Candidatus Heimdallarchaeota archaeon]